MEPEFDRFGASYEEVVNRALGPCGGDVDAFARKKADVLLSFLRKSHRAIASLRVLDLGSGIGLMEKYLRSQFRLLVGAEVAPLLAVRARHEVPWCSYICYDGETIPLDSNSLDVVFAVCVLHHVAPRARDRVFTEIHRIARPGGLACIFEQNPLNPLTRYVVSRCEFDRGVELIRAGHLDGLMETAGFTRVGHLYCTFLPTNARWSTTLERAFRAIPLGAQYMTYGVKAP